MALVDGGRSFHPSLSSGRHFHKKTFSVLNIHPKRSYPTLQIRYAISIEYESQLGGLLTPHINVPVRGEVPIERSTFTIHLPCTGNVSEEVPVGIHLEIDGYPHFNNTKLTFKRNKICIKGEK